MEDDEKVLLEAKKVKWNFTDRINFGIVDKLLSLKPRYIFLLDSFTGWGPSAES